MNFEVHGPLTLKMGSGRDYLCGDWDMRIGQGNSGGVSNNWWIASKDCSIVPLSHQLMCCCGNDHCDPSLTDPFATNYAIEIRPGDNDHDFYVYEWSPAGRVIPEDHN